jgi:hypothetical protein
MNHMHEELIKQRVRRYYWQDDLNCTTTTLKILAEIYRIEVTNQLLAAAVGMHGAGGYRAQCGLVEGGLLFIGVIGRANQLPDPVIVDFCYQYGAQFTERFSSLLCRELRPEGFGEHLPPHLCEDLTCRTITFSAEFIADMLTAAPQ